MGDHWDSTVGRLMANGNPNLRVAAINYAHQMLRTTNTPDWCSVCLGDGPLHPWPLPNEWGDRDELVCVRCWNARARGQITVEWRGRVGYLFTTHPQYGEVLRGTIRSCGIEPRQLRPVIRWRVADHDHNDLGMHVGDYADAERLLLDATTELDQVTPDDRED